MSAPSLAKFIIKRPWLKRWMVPFAKWYADAAGYRKLGLRYSTLKPHERTNQDSVHFFDTDDRIVASRNSGLSVRACRADDLIPEESDTVLLALKRLPPKEAYDRVFRLRRAFQVCQNHS